MSAAREPIQAVLFDFDGTLADSGADLAAAANALRTARGMPALPYEVLRPWASHGTRGLVGAAFGITPTDASYESLRDEFLANYSAALCVHTRLFNGMEELLERCESAGVPWGIVTNKHAVYAEPIVRALGLNQRMAVLVCGDTAVRAKPHPEPLLHAAAALHVHPQACVYVGDDERDIIAGRAAGMRTVAAAWGYCSGTDPGTWNADATLDSPLELTELLSQWGLPA